MKKRFDVLGLGCTAVDDLIYVDAYPPDVKVRALRRERHCGGLTGTALVTASRLGAHCAYAGCAGRGRLFLLRFDKSGARRVNLDHVVRRAGAGPVQSVIVVDQTHKTRNIFSMGIARLALTRNRHRRKSFFQPGSCSWISTGCKG